MPSWLILCVAAAYVAGLFWVAHRQEHKAQHTPSDNKGQAWLFGLALAVYCTSWTYYGAVGTAATGGWDYLPIYLGPILVFAFAGPLLKKLVKAGKAHHVTSIADFISARYGKSQRLAAFITVIAVIGALPYIALQLKSIAMTYSVMTGEANTASSQHDLVLVVAGVLALFALAFGTRHADITRPNVGLVRAIVVESSLKLLALLCIGGLAALVLTQTDPQKIAAAANSAPFALGNIDARFVSLTILAMGAVLCLPRQFHMLVVECTDPAVLPRARWVFVGYLLVTALVVPPIAMAGLAALPAGTAPDLFVLLLPTAQGQSALALLTFLGGFAAATGMVIVSSVALSIMVTNDLVIPALLKLRSARQDDQEAIALRQRTFRRIAIIGLLALAYGFHRIVTQEQTLAALGILSFAAAVQFLPSLIGGLYWPKGNKRGVFAGLVLGFALWLFTLVLPAIAPVFGGAQTLLESGVFGQAWLKPEALFGFALFDPLTHGLLWSLGLNAAAFVGVSMFVRADGIDLIQASTFSGAPPTAAATSDLETAARVKDLRALISRSIGEERALQAFEAYELLTGRHLSDRDTLDADLIRFGETQLTRVLGASSSRLLLQSILSGTSLKPEDVVTLLDETSQTLEFNRELLQATLENIPHGVCVVDKDMRIAAWNTPYVELFKYPADLVKIGRPIADVIRYNAQKGTWPNESAECVIAKRIGHMRAGKPHDFSRNHFDGRFLEIQGKPMPGGGYVTTYMDVTARVRAEDALKETNETLEQRVQDRTRDLEKLNEKLERATASKTRFLAAASHDLLQPLNAARLFTSALAEDIPADAPDAADLLQKIDQSIGSADTLLKALLNISKLDGDGVETRPSTFAAAELLQELVDDFSVIAREKGLALAYVPSSAVIRSDKALLRSVVQNFLSNAIRYTKSGRIVVGCRRAGDQLRIIIADTGVGIPEGEQQRIFQEFHQVKSTDSQPREGVGLGLAIVQRIARRLGHKISVRSTPGRGSSFEISVPRTEGMKVVSRQPKPVASQVAGLRVLCIDNDPTILSATIALLTRWGCSAQAVQTYQDLQGFDKDQPPPDLVLLDYQLDDGASGFEYLDHLVAHWGYQPAVILMTAAQGSDVEMLANERGVPVLAKPVPPAQLRALIRQTCHVTAVAE